ncbi:MAG: endonuclease/exonuclease/phosphatase family protein, partial [Actinomycetes bacterium]
EQVRARADLHTDRMAGGVLVGDFNAPPDAPELAALRERFSQAWELAPERDDRAGWRFWRGDEGDTFPASSPRKRIDQVWISAGVGVAAARVLDAEGASDHLPVVVDLEVRSGV